MENTNKYSYYNCETEIDLVDMALYLMKKWRAIIALTLLGALIGFGTVAYKEWKSSESQIDKAYSNLDISTVDVDSVEKLHYLNELYNQQLSDEKNMTIYSMDSKKVYYGELKYTFSADKEEYDEIIKNIKTSLESDTSLGYILFESKLNTDKRNLLKLIDITTYRYPELENENMSGEILITALAPNQIALDGMISALESVVDESIDKLSSSYVFSSARELNSGYGYRSEVDNEKESVKDLKEKYLEEINNIKDALSKGDKVYYEYNFGILESTGSKAKSTLIGAFVALFLICAYYCCIYIFDGKIKNENEISGYLGIHVIASIKGDGKEQKGIDKWVKNLKDKKSIPASNKEYLCQALDTVINNFSKEINKKDSDVLVELCCDDITDESLLGLSKGRIVVSGNLATDANAVKEMRNCDGIILTTQIGRTSKINLIRQANIAQTLDKPILGVICIKE